MLGGAPGDCMVLPYDLSTNLTPVKFWICGQAPEPTTCRLSFFVGSGIFVLPARCYLYTAIRHALEWSLKSMLESRPTKLVSTPSSGSDALQPDCCQGWNHHP